MWILEIEFERGWNFENDLRVRDLKKILSYENWEYESWILKDIIIVSYLRSRNYESWFMKIGNLENHLKSDFLEMNK